MSTVDVHEAKTHLSQLLDRVRAGDEIIIAKNGEPGARLVPIEKPKPRTPGLLHGAVEDACFAPLPDDELAAWER